MPYLETTAVVHNHRVVIEVPASFTEGTPLCVTLEANRPPGPAHAATVSATPGNAERHARLVSMLREWEKIPPRLDQVSTADDEIRENRERWDDERLNVYLDSYLVVHVTDFASPRRHAVSDALSQTRDVTWVYSDLVRLEARVRALRLSDVERLARIDAFFAECVCLRLTSGVYELATDLRAHSGLKIPDALHLACALVHGCDEFWTGDERFGWVNGGLSLKIVK